MKHSEDHEEIILNHLDGSLEEKNVNAAVYLLQQCGQCRQVYEKSLLLRSKAHRTNILTDFEKEDRDHRAVEKLRIKPHGVRAWWQVAAALLLLTTMLPLGLYFKRLRGELQARASELDRIKKENENLSGKIKDREAALASAAKQTLPDSGPSATASLQRPSRVFLNPQEFLLDIAEIRGQQTSQGARIIEVPFPSSADLLHLALVPDEKRSYDQYRVVIADSKDKTIGQYDNARKDRYGNFNVYFPRDAARDRDYVIRIFGLEHGHASLVFQQRIRLN